MNLLIQAVEDLKAQVRNGQQCRGTGTGRGQGIRQGKGIVVVGQLGGKINRRELLRDGWGR